MGPIRRRLDDGGVAGQTAHMQPGPLPQARLDQMVTHPVFDYRCSWRAIIRVQARLLAKTLRGDVPAYTGITTR